MLSETGQWFKTTDIETNDEKLTQRKTAAATLVTTWERASPAIILQAVSLGLEALRPISSTANPVLTSVVEAMSDAQPSLDPEIACNGLEPRLVALVAIGELLNRRLSRDATWRRREPALLAAACLVAALRNVASVGSGYLVSRVLGLLRTSETLLGKMDQSRRSRGTSVLGTIKLLKAASDLSVLRETASEALTELYEDQLVDREELQALWWVFGGYSILAGEPFSAVPNVKAALYSGAELASIISWPATSSMAMLAQRILRKDGDRSSENLLGELGELNEECWQQAVPSHASGTVAAFPAIFPITSAAFVAPAERNAHVAGLRDSLDAYELAAQVYMERSLQQSIDG